MRTQIALAISLFGIARCLAQLPAPPGPLPQIKDIQIPRIERKPLLQEFLDGHPRPDMRRIDDFRQREPGDGVPVSRKTTAWIGYDDKNLYAILVCESPAGKTRAHLSKREDIFSDDLVGIYLDTYHDRQRSYGFFLNAYGVQADAYFSEGQDEDYNFDTLWYSEGRLTTEGYAVSFTIPFKSLRFPAAGVQTWGLGIGRLIPDNTEFSFWPFVTQKIQGFHQQLGNMSGLENIAPGRNLRITPYGAFGQSHFLDTPANGTPAFRSDTTLRGGLDAKAVIHDSLTLDVTVNPDFSQVESDDPQVTINQRYEVLFPEKRPFFLENTGYFVTPENLFFSRRIVDPEFGARLTGKLGKWTMGFLGIDDRAPGAALISSDPDFGSHAIIGVARIQREFKEQSFVGLLFTDREFAGDSNRVAGLDTRLKLNANWTFTGQAILSQTSTGVGHSGGDAFNFDLHGQNREWNYDLKYIDRAEGFHTDLGFVPRVNIRQAHQTLGRLFRPKSKWILSIGPQLDLAGDFDHHNVQQDWNVQPSLNLTMAGSTFIGAYHNELFERFNAINFRRRDNGFFAHTEYFKSAIFDVGLSKGTRIDYDVPGNLPAFLGRGSEFHATVTLHPLARLKLDEIYYLTRLDTASSAVFINHLARSRLNYQFTRELSLRLIVDYNAVLQNPALVNLERQKRISGDVLLTYLIHPGTAFYIGYTDRLENLALTPGRPPAVERIGFPSTTTGRQFFAKISYQFRF